MLAYHYVLFGGGNYWKNYHFGLHCRYLAVLQGRRFKAPKLSGVWSGDFHHFVKWTLSHNPMKRPTADEVIRESDFLNKVNIGPHLMLAFLRKPPDAHAVEGNEMEHEGVVEVDHRDDNDDKILYSAQKAEAKSG